MKGVFKGGSEYIKKVVNNNFDTFDEDDVGYSIQARGFIQLEFADSVADLLSREGETWDRCDVFQMRGDSRGGGRGEKKELARSLALSMLDMAK